MAGTAARLYDVLGPQWAFIGPQSLAAVAADRLGAVTALSGTRPGLLIRPDGHVAWKGSDPTALRAWLDSALGRVAVPAA